jgi:ketosteroid isomerase-like protein
MSTDETAIRTLLDRRALATTAKDAEGSLRALAQDVVSYDLAPPLALRGAAAVDPNAAEQWFASWDGPIGFDITDLTIRSAGHVAFCYGFVHMHGKRTNGEHTDLWARATVCLEKRSDTWQIVHEHTSVPMLMDGSGKAAIDLKP